LLPNKNQPPDSSFIHIKQLNTDEWSELLQQQKQPLFRKKQLEEWLWKKRAMSFPEMTNIPEHFRTFLQEKFICSSILSFDESISLDTTRKYAFYLGNNDITEGVLIPSEDRVTACISTQVGCPLNCKFCATGSLGFSRNLSFAEIHDQIVFLFNKAEEVYNKPLSNIVVMGMGEPLLNYENTMLALEKISNKELMNFSPQRITLSTSGIVPGIKRMADEKIPYGLAISLHSAIQEKRKKMMPVSNKYPLIALSEALKYYHKKTENRITIEYILFENINNEIEDAEALARFCLSFPVKINIISYNYIQQGDFKKSQPKKTEAFTEFLKSKNIIVNIRNSKGSDIAAACGQLAGIKKQHL
jgi:23S rRNA (adenine2503-C2)-methyltransferase